MKNTIMLVMLVAMTMSGCMCTHVEGGYVGVEVDECGNGGIKETPVGVGYHGSGPCTSIIEFPTFQQTASFKDDSALQVQDSNGMSITADVVLSFTIDAAKAPAIYGKFRKDLEQIQQVYFRQVTYEAMKDVYEDLTAQDLYSGKQETARAAVQALLTDKLGKDGFIVTQFSVNKVTPPPNVVAAIQSKVAMIEEAQKVELELRKTEAEAKQKVATAEGEGTVTKTRAEAEAAATKMRADAEAYANRKIIESINPTLVEYMRVQKWNGQLAPVTTVTGGANIAGSTSK